MSTSLPPEWASLLRQLQETIRAQSLGVSRTAGALPIPSLADWLAATTGNPEPVTEGFNPWSDDPGANAGIDPDKWRALSRYGQALSALQSAWLEIGLAALSESQPNSTTGHPTFREHYDQWTQTGERLFAERAATDSYGQLISELINAQVDLHLAYGIGEAPPPEDPQELKEALAEARAREKQLREDLAALKAQTATSSAPVKKRSPQKPARRARSSAKAKPPAPKNARGGATAGKKKTAPARKKKTAS